jgi:hypothetical protein
MNNMFGGCSNLVNLRLSEDFNFIGTNHRFSDTGNDWVKVRHADGKKTYDSTTYLATQIATLNNIDSTPLLGGTWIKNHTGDDYATNPDGSIEYISEDDYWIINSDNVWMYSFSVFDDSLLFYLYEEIIEGYNSEAMAPYYITVKDNTATIVNEKADESYLLPIIEGVDPNAGLTYNETYKINSLQTEAVFCTYTNEAVPYPDFVTEDDRVKVEFVYDNVIYKILFRGYTNEEIKIILEELE